MRLLPVYLEVGNRGMKGDVNRVGGLGPLEYLKWHEDPLGSDL